MGSSVSSISLKNKNCNRVSLGMSTEVSRRTEDTVFLATFLEKQGMKIYEYGMGNPECILLIPALSGYDFNDGTEFGLVERIASELADDLLQKALRYTLRRHKNTASR